MRQVVRCRPSDQDYARNNILVPHTVVLSHPERLYGIEVAPARLYADILQAAVT
jgi:hypothetical protein